MTASVATSAFGASPSVWVVMIVQGYPHLARAAANLASAFLGGMIAAGSMSASAVKEGAGMAPLG